MLKVNGHYLLLKLQFWYCSCSLTTIFLSTGCRLAIVLTGNNYSVNRTWGGEDNNRELSSICDNMRFNNEWYNYTNFIALFQVWMPNTHNNAII